MSRIVFLTAMLAGLVLQASTVFAGGWTHAPGKGYFKLNEQIIRSDSYFEPSGDRIDITDQNRYTTSLYGEYGLANRLTLVGYLPFYQRISEDRHGSEAKTGTGDWELGARIGLLTSRATVVSIQVMAGLPLGDSFSDQQEVGLFTGDGEFNQLFMLQVGHSLWPTPGYLKAEIGYNNRESDFSDEIRYAVEAGFMVGERFGVSGWVRGAKAIGTDGEWTVYDQQYVSFGPEVSFYVTSNAGITAGVTRYTGAHNVLDAPAWDIGLFLKL
ncbi:MAG: hypothetical protein F4132_08260 [Gemmatimonadetes bacterium]|nr:hypothetical protein [Gemmatimonadota bacterium]MYH19087.1 hypothetical protein [Gemmatimonadota bacterium]